MGAHIDLVNGHAPITIHGSPLHAIDFDTPIPSAQVKTAVLFAGLQANGTTSLTESIRTRDHSEHALRAFGAILNRTDEKLSIPGGQKLIAIDATVPGDLSSAAFFLCAALLFPDSNLVLDSIGMNPTRASLLDVITSLGGKIKVLNVEEHHGELIGTIQVNGPASGPRGMHIGGALSAQIIDELPVLAAIAPYTINGITIRDARELRVKESDRIALVAQNLKAMGSHLHGTRRRPRNPGNQRLHGAQIDSGSDHRIAMAFASQPASRRRHRNPWSRSRSHQLPEFFTHLDALPALVHHASLAAIA
jgi:3-phosphoshikimate 1-carboxyvinyltransferase